MFYRRKKMLARISAIILAAVISVPCTVLAAPDNTQAPVTETPVPAPAPFPIETNGISGWPQAEDVTSKTACLMDANTGAVLYNKGMMEKTYPASTTKIMTALVAIENSKIDEKVVFTQTGVAEAYSGSSNLYTQVGEEFTMENCLYALLMKSANDFASQIAEHVGGSVAGFVQKMNDKAAELGCTNTHFNNAHGMPDENHYTCAYDMALIMREALKNPTFCKVTSAQTYTIPASSLIAARSISSHNALIMPTDLFYEGCLGGKTGYTDSAMYTFVTAADRNGMKLISSTMHAPSSAESFIDARHLFDYGFTNFQNLVIEEGSDVYSGGTVTIPKAAKKEDLTIETGEKFETDFGTMVNQSYRYQGYEVGAAEVTKETYDASQVTETPTPTEAAETDTASPKEVKKLNPTMEPFSKELFTVPHLVMAGIGSLILIGIIAIIGTLIHKHKKKK